jgi:hypothetical protein
MANFQLSAANRKEKRSLFSLVGKR